MNKDISDQISSGENRIFGVMIESHLEEGNQKIGPLEEIKYGQSITDACVGWNDTEIMINQLSTAIENKRKKLHKSA